MPCRIRLRKYRMIWKRIAELRQALHSMNISLLQGQMKHLSADLDQWTFSLHRSFASRLQLRKPDQTNSACNVR